MQKLPFLGAIAFVITAHASHAHAQQEGPWCARSWGGSDYYANCTMQSLAMCLAENRGTGGNTICSPNPNQRVVSNGRGGRARDGRY